MSLLAIIKPEDVDESSPSYDYTEFKKRHAVRAIVFDGDKVALIKVGKHDYYMLPGGGVDEDANTKEALARELQEELGVVAEAGSVIGTIEVYMDRWKKRQIDECYVAKKLKKVEASITDFEKEEGHAVVWAKNLNEAYRLVATATPQERDGKLVQTRDALFLRHILQHKPS
jgi:8-oxo-dGTP pyrophosphatase MutT (NUDIX family)